MSAELDFTKGFAAIAYSEHGGVPWHRQGQPMLPGQPFDIWLQMAGLDWNVEEEPIFTTNKPGRKWPRREQLGPYREIPSRKALVRDDTGDILSVVSDRYKVVQPGEVMEFFRSLVEDLDYEIDTAGSLYDGRRVWVLARTGREFNLVGDRVKDYLLLSTSYDGSSVTAAKETTIRVVCRNTLEYTLGGNVSSGKNDIRIPHTSTFNAADVKQRLGLSKDGFQAFENKARQLSEASITRKQAVEFYLDLFGCKEDDDELPTVVVRDVKSLLDIRENAPGQNLVSAKNTAWGLVNGVTYFADHIRPARSDSGRLNRTWFGDSADLKNDAMNRALALVEAA